MKYETPNIVGNYQCTAYFKGLHYDATLKREVIIYAVEHGNRTGCKLTTSKANVRLKIDFVSVVSWKSAIKEFIWPKKGRRRLLRSTILSERRVQNG